MHLTQTFSEYFPPNPTLTEADLPSLAGKTYLITGGAAGVGKELVRMLYSANATVYIAGRSLANIEKATKEITENPSKSVTTNPTSGQIIPLILDLSDLTTIKPAVQEFQQKVNKLDALVLNAGVMSTINTNDKTAQGHELHFGTNVVGHFLLQSLLMSLLLASTNQNEQVRIIWTASDATDMSPSPDGIYWHDLTGEKTGRSSWNMYAQSKAGNVILAAETARRYGSDNIISVSLNPGHLKSELQRDMGPCAKKILYATLMYDARYGALTELYAIFSGAVNKETNGSYLIPWGRLGKLANHLTKGLEKGSGTRLWDILERETRQYA